MTKFYVCGQAPSRAGDGRAFSGPSGRRLASLFGLGDYEELASRVYLTNIFPVPAARKPLPARRRTKRHAGDEFDEITARRMGMRKMHAWARDPELVVVLGCGQKVTKALVGQEMPFYAGKALHTEPARGVDVWSFPHPSGASHYWNDPANVAHAAHFLGRLLERYGIALHQ